MSETELANSLSAGKKHKKHKSEKRERRDGSSSDRPPGLKLILKVGSQNTPEHNTEWTYPPGYNPEDGQDDALRSSHHKKSKKKKKKKDKNKDREKKHKHHHHKERKRRRDESNGEPAADEEKDETKDDAHLDVSMILHRLLWISKLDLLRPQFRQVWWVVLVVRENHVLAS